MTAPGWFLAEQRERAREFADMDRYYAEIDAQDEIDRSTPLQPLVLVDCAFCSTPTYHGLCRVHGIEKW